MGYKNFLLRQLITIQNKILILFRLEIWIILSILLYSNILFSQYAPSDLTNSNALGMSLASSGIAMEERGSNIYSNPSILMNKNKSIIDGTLSLAKEYKGETPVRINGGFFYSWNEKFGFGLAMNPFMGNNFPDKTTNVAYQVPVFAVYKINENLFISGGLGISTIFQQSYQSSYSWTIKSGITYITGKSIFAFTIQNPGKFRLDKYRGSDKLQERLPVYIVLGASHKLGDLHTIYFETRKLFWETSSFQLNGSNMKPSLDRGIGAEIKFSFGYQYSINKEETFKLRGGLEIGGSYDGYGKNRRGTGIGFGASYYPFKESNSNQLGISIGILDYSLLYKKGGKEPETNLIFSFNYESL